MITMTNPIILKEGVKIVLSSWKKRVFGIKRYSGNAATICKAIIEDCWNKQQGFFQVSAGHYDLFYMRDFGWCCQALLKLGHEERVRKTLLFALKHYKRHGAVTTSITKHGFCFDYPCYSVDSLPYLLSCINLLGDQQMLQDHQLFLNEEVKRFYSNVIDPQTGLVKKETPFSSMRDHIIRNSSCYDNCFVAFLQQQLSKAKILDNPFKHRDYEQLIKKYYWQGRFFYDDLNAGNYATGDATVFPFYLGIFYDLSMMRSALKTALRTGLAKPFPLKYTHKRHSEEHFIFAEHFVKNWETTSIWTHMGPLFIKLMQQIDKKQAQQFIQQYQDLVEQHGNYLEVFNEQGKPYKSFFYFTDTSMLWSANLLLLLPEQSKV